MIKNKILKWLIRIYLACIALVIIGIGSIALYIFGSYSYCGIKTQMFFYTHRDEFEELAALYTYEDWEPVLFEENEKSKDEILEIFKENNYSTTIISLNQEGSNIEIMEFSFCYEEKIFNKKYCYDIVKYDEDEIEREEVIDYLDKMWSPRRMKKLKDNWIITFDGY